MYAYRGSWLITRDPLLDFAQADDAGIAEEGAGVTRSEPGAPPMACHMSS